MVSNAGVPEERGERGGEGERGTIIIITKNETQSDAGRTRTLYTPVNNSYSLQAWERQRVKKKQTDRENGEVRWSGLREKRRESWEHTHTHTHTHVPYTCVIDGSDEIPPMQNLQQPVEFDERTSIAGEAQTFAKICQRTLALQQRRFDQLLVANVSMQVKFMPNPSSHLSSLVCGRLPHDTK